MQNMEHTTQTSTIKVRQDQPMRKQTYKTPLTKQDINENRQSFSAPPYRTGMLIGDTSRQHLSREITHAGHKSYEGNNTGKQQQNMILESPTNDFREKEENQTCHAGVELNNYFFRENGSSTKTARPLSKGSRTGVGQRPETMLEIVMLNIEGI